jgi:hypothetical protein
VEKQKRVGSRLACKGRRLRHRQLADILGVEDRETDCAPAVLAPERSLKGLAFDPHDLMAMAMVFDEYAALKVAASNR